MSKDGEKVSVALPFPPRTLWGRLLISTPSILGLRSHPNRTIVIERPVTAELPPPDGRSKCSVYGPAFEHTRWKRTPASTWRRAMNRRTL